MSEVKNVSFEVQKEAEINLIKDYLFDIVQLIQDRSGVDKEQRSELIEKLNTLRSSLKRQYI